MRGTTTPSIGRATLESVIVAGPAKTGLGFYPPPTACLPAANAPLLHHHQSSISAWTPLHRRPSSVSLHTIPAFAAGHGSTCRAGLRYLQHFLVPSRPSPSAGPPCATRRLKPPRHCHSPTSFPPRLISSIPAVLLLPQRHDGRTSPWRTSSHQAIALDARTTSTTAAPCSPLLPRSHRSMFDASSTSMPPTPPPPAA